MSKASPKARLAATAVEGVTYPSPKLGVSMPEQTANLLNAGVHARLSFQEVLSDLGHQGGKAHEGRCILVWEDHQEWRQDVCHACMRTRHVDSLAKSD